MKKDINEVVQNIVKRANDMFDNGTISECVAPLDVTCSLLVMAHQGKLNPKYKSDIYEYALKYEEESKYAKPLPVEVVEYIKSRYGK
ncbi:hypothetical protein MM5_070 [Morganella phage vB_Mm5]